MSNDRSYLPHRTRSRRWRSRSHACHFTNKAQDDSRRLVSTRLRRALRDPHRLRPFGAQRAVVSVTKKFRGSDCSGRLSRPFLARPSCARFRNEVGAPPSTTGPTPPYSSLPSVRDDSPSPRLQPSSGPRRPEPRSSGPSFCWPRCRFCRSLWRRISRDHGSSGLPGKSLRSGRDILTSRKHRAVIAAPRHSSVPFRP